MGRPKRNVKIPEYVVEYVQHYLDMDATIEEYQKRYVDAEIAGFIESQECSAQSIVGFLSEELGLVGKPDMRRVEEDYEYYESTSRVKSEYRKENK